MPESKSESKPVVYLLPGLLCDATCWEAQAEALSDIAEVRIPSFKGFDSLRGMARSVLDTAPPRFSVAGHSMGGRVAWEVVHLGGNRIDKFAVLDTGIHPVSEEEPIKRQKLLDLADESMQALADYWIPPMVHHGRVTDRALMEAIERMALGYTREEFRGQIHALLNREDQAQYLPLIEQEVLLICGAEDTWSPVSQHRDMLKLLKNAKLEVIEDCGHMVTMEQPEALNRVLLEWLTN